MKTIDQEQLRQKALDVFKNSDTEILVKLIGLKKNFLPTSQVDSFEKFLMDSLSDRQESIEKSEKNLYTSSFRERVPGNVNGFIKKMQTTDKLYNPKKQFFIKKKHGAELSDIPRSSNVPMSELLFSEKRDVINTNDFNVLFRGPGAHRFKKPENLEQENENIVPLGMKPLSSMIEPQENHSDDEALW